jgi:hypothetical protein
MTVLNIVGEKKTGELSRGQTVRNWNLHINFNIKSWKSSENLLCREYDENLL